LLVMGTVVILDTINDQIANANLDSIRPLNLPEWSGGTGSSDPCEGIDGCVVDTCPIMRATVWCSTWCSDRNGSFVDNGYFTAAQCAFRPSNEIDCETRPAPGIGNPIADCRNAITECESGGGYYVEQINGTTPEDAAIACRPQF